MLNYFSTFVNPTTISPHFSTPGTFLSHCYLISLSYLQTMCSCIDFFSWNAEFSLSCISWQTALNLQALCWFHCCFFSFFWFPSLIFLILVVLFLGLSLYWSPKISWLFLAYTCLHGICIFFWNWVLLILVLSFI